MPKSNISPRITNLLSRLRGKIRSYVWIEGIALAIIWLIATFWISLAIDYLPVKLGASEMPVVARAVLLVIVSLALLFILYRWVLRRAFVSLQRKSLAVLIERSYPEFEDSLVTTVELDNEPPDDNNASSELQQSMLREAHDKAVRHVDQVKLGKVFNYNPLRRAIGIAAIAIASIILTAIVSLPSLKMWANRIYGLSPDPYPRMTHLEIEDFSDGQLTVARGSNVTLRVRSDATRKAPPPEVCTIYYRTENGERGRANMSKKGTPRDGFQNYVFDGKPFKGILGNIDFDIVGNDQRIRDQLVRVVDSPQIAAITIDCERPTYTQLSKIQLEYYPGVRIPQGSRLNLKLKTNKPIVEATWQENQDATPVTLEPTSDDPNSVTLVIDQLDQSISQEVTLLDTDGVASKRPYRISIAAIPDEAPTVQLRLSGIGSAVTPDVRIPMSGNISDDYGVSRSWFEIEPQSETWTPRQFEIATSSGDIDAALDLREERSKSEDPFELQVDSKIVLSVRSSDRFDLSDDPNVGESDRYELEVVDANRLIALLEARELGLRRRFDQIISEMKETRDSLSRVQYAPTADDEGLKEADQPTAEERLERASALRLLRVQRGEQHSQRAAQEILGVALSFEDIRQELINNRVDATDRRNRIENDIANPLKDIADTMFPVLDGRLGRLRSNLEGGDPEAETRAAAVSAVAQADQILIRLEAVLEKMLELETYNELVDLIRKMIRDQEDLTERTKEQQKKSALDLLN